MSKLTHEQFDKMWEDSTKEEVLFQFYYDYYAKVEALDKIDKAIKYIEEHKRNVYDSFGESLVFGEIEGVQEILSILRGEE